MVEIPPSVLAKVDQWQADCDHVIGLVRQHRDFACNVLAGPCVGEQAMAHLMTLSRGEGHHHALLRADPPRRPTNHRRDRPVGNVKIAAHYTKDTRINNGLDSIQEKLTADPDTRVMVVGIVEVTETGIAIRDGHRPFLKVNVFAIEPAFGEDAVEVRTILDRLVKARTGQVVPPTLFDKPDEDEEPWDEGPPRGNRNAETDDGDDD